MLFIQRLRGAVSFVGIGIKNAARDLDAATPTITSGTGVPATTPPDGSVYMRTDGTNATDSLYQRIAGAWVAYDGS